MSTYDCQEEYIPDSEVLVEFKRVAYGIVGPVIVAVGIASNILSLIALQYSTLAGAMYSLLAALSVSNTFNLGFAATFLADLTYPNNKTWPAAVYSTYFQLPLANSFSAISVFIILIMTIDRYLSISHPARFKRFHRRITVIRGISVTVPVCIALHVPSCWARSMEAVDSTGNLWHITENCQLTHTSWYRTYMWTLQTVVRIGPLLVLTVLNVVIIVKFRALLHVRKRLQGPLRIWTIERVYGASPVPKSAEERRLVLVLIIIIVLFVCCTTPAAILMILTSEDLVHNFKFEVFRAIANLLELMNFASCSYVLCLCSSEFRKALLHTVCFCRNLKSSSHS